MAKNLIEKGNLEKPLLLYNRTRTRADETSARLGHSVVARTVNEVVEKADIIWLCLKNQEALVEVFDEILRSEIRGKLFLDCSSVLPDVTTNISQRVLDAGAEFVAMPVFGEPTLAAKGALTCILAGPSSSVLRIKPYIHGVVGKAIVDLSGEPPAKASLLKIIGNVVILTTIETIAEVEVFAEKTGMATSYIQQLFDTLLPTPLHSVYSTKMANGSYHSGKPMVEVQLAQDLAAHVLDLAEKSNTSLKSYKVAIGHLDAAGEHSGLSSDISGIYGAVRMESGLPFEKLERG
jgi:3-hydroxyisobutyrate dehydrogenase-like beta-hydroxyacid dehydrogenase